MKRKDKLQAAAKQAEMNAPVVQVIQNADIEILRSQAEEIKTATEQLGEKYLNLCRHIRAKSMPPRIVSETLKAVGFNKVRISEINRVAQCGDELWNEFEARSIGFKGVLQLERNTSENVGAIATGGADVGEGDGEGESDDAPDTEAAKIAGMARCAKTILNAAEFLNLRSKKWTLGNGWTLQLTRDPKTKPPKEKPEQPAVNTGQEQ